jgi:hypothetical protein
MQDLAVEIEKSVQGIKQNYLNNQFEWFVNFFDEGYLQSVEKLFKQQYPVDVTSRRRLTIPPLTTEEYRRSYQSFTTWLENQILSQIGTNTPENIKEARILRNSLLVAQFHKNLAHDHQDMLVTCVLSICARIDADKAATFRRYIRVEPQRYTGSPTLHFTSALRQIEARIESALERALRLADDDDA